MQNQRQTHLPNFNLLYASSSPSLNSRASSQRFLNWKAIKLICQTVRTISVCGKVWKKKLFSTKKLLVANSRKDRKSNFCLFGGSFDDSDLVVFRFRDYNLKFCRATSLQTQRGGGRCNHEKFWFRTLSKAHKSSIIRSESDESAHQTLMIRVVSSEKPHPIDLCQRQNAKSILTMIANVSNHVANHFVP